MAIVHDQETIYLDAYGMADPETGRAVALRSRDCSGHRAAVGIVTAMGRQTIKGQALDIAQG